LGFLVKYVNVSKMILIIITGVLSKLEAAPNKKLLLLGKKQKFVKAIWMIFLHGIAMNVVEMGIIFMLAPLFTDSEPSFYVLRIFFGKGMKSWPWVFRILRSILNGLLGIHWSSCGMNTSLFALGILQMSKEFLGLLLSLSAAGMKGKQREMLLVRKLTFSYRQLLILLDAFNATMRWSIAVGMAAAMGIFVLGGSGSVLLAGKVNWTTYVLFPLVAATMVFVVLLIGPAAEKTYILSSDFMFCYKSEGLEKPPFRVSKAMKLLRIEAGSVYFFERASTLSILVAWVENLINVLMSV
jgi:hypothetical protein